MVVRILLSLTLAGISWSTTALQPSKTSTQVLPTPDHYDCQLIVIAPELAQSGSQTLKFRAIGPQTETHGGIVYSFPVGGTQVQVQANSRWRAITWLRKDKTIAAVTHLRSSDSHESEVTIAFNPLNEEESVTLECRPSEQ